MSVPTWVTLFWSFLMPLPLVSRGRIQESEWKAAHLPVKLNLQRHPLTHSLRMSTCPAFWGGRSLLYRHSLGTCSGKCLVNWSFHSSLTTCKLIPTNINNDKQVCKIPCEALSITYGSVSKLLFWRCVYLLVSVFFGPKIRKQGYCLSQGSMSG